MYSPRLLPAALIAALALIATQFGCSSNTPKPDAPPQQASQTQQQEPATDIFARYAPFMPADTAAVAIVRTEMASQLIQDVFYSPDEGSEHKHLDAMRADFGTLLLSNFGIDPLSADFGFFVLSPSTQFLILDGAIKTDFTTQKKVESNGLVAHFLCAPRCESDAGIWVSSLPDTNGLAVFRSPVSFEAVATTYSNPSRSLQKRPRADIFRDLLSTAKDAAIAGAIAPQDALKQNIDQSFAFPSPNAASFHIDRELRVEFRADAQKLENLQRIIEGYRRTVIDAVEARYQNRDDQGPLKAGMAILPYHLTRHLNENLKITRTPESLVLKLPLPRGLIAISAFSMGSTLAIPAFLKYLKRSKSAEAPGILQKLEASALQYYSTSNADGACHFPPSANPVPAGEPCCENVGPRDGKKWSPPAQTWSQDGWKALDFSMSDPTYFAYQMINKSGDVNVDVLELRAFAHFDTDGPRDTYSITLKGHANEHGECVAKAGPVVESLEQILNRPPPPTPGDTF